MTEEKVWQEKLGLSEQKRVLSDVWVTLSILILLY